MERTLEVIRDAHQIDQALGRIAEVVTDNTLKSRILELKEQWQPIAYEVSARLSGVEVPSTPRKRRGGRRPKAVAADAAVESSQVVDDGAEKLCAPDLT